MNILNKIKSAAAKEVIGSQLPISLQYGAQGKDDPRGTRLGYRRGRF